MTSSVLLNVAFVCNFAYLNYIMNFSKVNVRDLAKAKYEDTYLLTNTNFRRSFICRIHLRPRMRNGCHILKQTFHF